MHYLRIGYSARAAKIGSCQRTHWSSFDISGAVWRKRRIEYSGSYRGRTLPELRPKIGLPKDEVFDLGQGLALHSAMKLLDAAWQAE